LKRKYIYADRQILAQHDIDEGEEEDFKYFYLHDRLGSVRQVIDDQSAVKNSYTYEPFGEMFATECTETTENPFKFTGQYFDSEIEEYYLRACPERGRRTRQYNPHIARFTSRAPVAPDGFCPLPSARNLSCNSN
jgi:RHS repeat-associated protein